MRNNFFVNSKDPELIALRLKQLEEGKIGFYSVGLYPASLAYNSAIHTGGEDILLAPREGRDIMGAFDDSILSGMEDKYIDKVINMSTHTELQGSVINSLEYLFLKCELVILSANSNHIEEDLIKAIEIRKNLSREEVVIACLVGSFCYEKSSSKAYLLCQKETNLAFFSGFHRHGALRNPRDSFTANFCHPDAFTALFGARLLDKISPNIQVVSGVHNLEGQYVKASKNMSSIFAGFAHTFHKDNPGLLPTLLTLLLDQCLNQAAIVSMSRPDRSSLYSKQPFPITELGYGVQLIEAAVIRDGDMQQVRDHTFSQLTAMVADVKGSMMLPQAGSPTRNFQVGQVLAQKLFALKRCPLDIDELFNWCDDAGLRRGGLEGLTSLQYLPEILKAYLIPFQDSSMITLLYISIFGSNDCKKLAYEVLTESRELIAYCKESVKLSQGQYLSKLLDNAHIEKSKNIIVNSILNNSFSLLESNDYFIDLIPDDISNAYSHSVELINIIQAELF
ncbi:MULTISPECIES: hypothetical protein [Prochlorococcus]|uniref:hypothetical protein n=1 Tax=Prochlorococcus TaxID=1218 RepID=UPI000533941A|nr:MULTISPECIES: hypothetical protein [Prochlorococcus]KGG12591.1 hypothetical protein EV05_1803 [Prochlorococcus sp. MIT 0601]